MGFGSKLLRRSAGAVRRTADMRPGFFDQILELDKKATLNKFDNARVTGNAEFHKNNLFEVNKKLDDIDFGDLTKGEADAAMNVRAKYLEAMNKTELTQGGEFKSGGIKDEAFDFKRKVDTIEEGFRKSSPETEGAAKFMSAVRNTLSNQGKKAISTPADYKIDIDGLLDIKKETAAFEAASKRSGFEEWVGADNGGELDGFFQNSLKMMNASASPDVMASQITGYFGKEIDNGFQKFAIAIPDAGVKETGIKAAIRQVSTIRELVEKNFGNNSDFLNKEFRRGVSNKKMLDNLKKVEQSLIGRLENQLDVNYAKEGLAKFNGDMISTHLDKIKVVDGQLTTEGKALLSLVDNKIFDVFSYSFKNIIPKEGLAVSAVEKGAGQLVKAMYMFDSLGKTMPLVDMMEQALKLDKYQFGAFANPDIVEHLAKHLKTSDEYMGTVFKRLDETELQILDKNTIKQHTAIDHGIGKATTKEINNTVNSSLRSFKMSNAGFLGKEKIKIDTSQFGGLDNVFAKGAIPEAIAKNNEVLLNAKEAIKDGFFNKTTLRVKETFPRLAKFFRNNGAGDAITRDLSGINKFFNKQNSIRKNLDLVRAKYSVIGGKNLDFIGGFGTKNLPLDDNAQALYKGVVDLNASMKAELSKVGYFTDEGASQFAGSILNRSKNKMATKADFVTTEKVLKKFMKTNNSKEAIKKTLEALSPNGEKMIYWNRLIEDVIDPIGAELRLNDNLSRAMVQVEYLGSLKSNKSLRFNKAPGYKKLSSREINLKMLEDVFGTKNIYLPEIEVGYLNKTVGLFGEEMQKTASQMVKDFSFAGMANFARHATLMFPTTRALVDSGNLLMAWSQLGIDPVQFVRHYSDYFKFKKSNSLEYQAFQNSGIASESGLASVVNRKGKDFGKRVQTPFAQKYNILNRESDVSQIAYHYMIDQPDEMFRFMTWRELSAKGMGIDDINKVLRDTIGNADEAPSIVKRFSNAPFGDVFSTYSYMMTRNFANIMSNNPKQFFKVSAYMMAIQQGSIYTFLNEQERANLKKTDASWTKPTLFNSMRLDPSFATWGGRYNVANFHSPWTTDFGGGEDSLRPEAIVMKGIMNQSSPKDMIKQQVKAFRKTSQASSALGNGKYGEALYKLLGPTYTRRLSPSQ